MSVLLFLGGFVAGFLTGVVSLLVWVGGDDDEEYDGYC